MMSKRRTTIAGAAVLSILLLGLIPVFAQATQPTPTETDKASIIIQVATAARGYAEQLVSIAQQHQVNTTKADSLISQGDPLLARAQSEVGTNATLAIKDALGAMSDYKGAAQSVQSALAGSLESSNAGKVEYLKDAIKRLQDKVDRLQAMLDKLCVSQNAASKACTDATADLASATSDLKQATSLLSSSDPDIQSIVKLLKDAEQQLSKVYADIKQLADDQKADKAVSYIQDNLEKRLSKLQDEVAKLDPSVAQQYKAQLDQAQSLLTSAIQDFKSGSFDAGVKDAKQATQIMQQVSEALRGAKAAQYVQTVLQGKLDKLKDMAQKANLSPSVSQQVQAQLAQAQSLLDGAVKSFLSGDLKAGGQQVQQAMQLMQQIYQEITSSTPKP